MATAAPYVFQYELDFDEFNHDITTSGDSIWLMGCAFVMMSMQMGFALMESGLVTSRSQVCVAFQNVLNMAGSAVFFFVIGYGLAFGRNGNGFIGTSDFALTEESLDTPARWFFEWVLVSVASTILSGATIGRFALKAYFLYSCFIVAWVYPTVAHWTRGHEGALSDLGDEGAYARRSGWLKDLGYFDFACAGSVHLLGGVCGLVGTRMLGPSQSFSQALKTKRIQARSNIGQAVLGCTVIVCGWFSFLGGAPGGVGGHGNTTAMCIAVATTTIGMSFSTVAGCLWSYYQLNWEKCDAIDIMHACLGGMVSTAAVCADCQPFEAMIIGIVTGVIVPLTSRWVARCGIDDPVNVVGCHLVPAIWGILATGLFANGFNHDHKGIFHGGDATLLAVQFLGVISIVAWVSLWCYAFLYVLSFTMKLRVTEEEERRGLDETEHGLINMELRSMAALEKCRRHSRQAERRDSVQRQLSLMGLRMRRVDEQVLVTLEDLNLLQEALAQSGNKVALDGLALSPEHRSPQGDQPSQADKAIASPVKAVALTIPEQPGSPAAEIASTEGINNDGFTAATTAAASTKSNSSSPRPATPESTNESAWQEMVSQALLRVATVLPAEAGIQPLSPQAARRITLALQATETTGNATATAIASVDISPQWSFV